MFDIGPSDHKPLPLLEIDAPQLCLNNTTISNNFYQHVQIFWWLNNSSHDIQLVRKVGPEIHNIRIVFFQEIDLMRREFVADITRGCRQQVWERAAKCPIEIFESVDAVGMVCQQTSFVPQNRGLVYEC